MQCDDGLCSRDYFLLLLRFAVPARLPKFLTRIPLTPASYNTNNTVIACGYLPPTFRSTSSTRYRLIPHNWRCPDITSKWAIPTRVYLVI